MMRNYILIISLLLFASCVPTRAPKDVNRAKNKAGRHTEGLENIVKRHPELSDSLKIEIKGELFIESIEDSSLQLTYVDTLVFDSLTIEYAKLYKQYEEVINYNDALVLEKSVSMPRNSHPYRKDPKQLQDIIKKLQSRLLIIRNEMIKNVSDSLGTFRFEDDNIVFNSSIDDSGIRISNYKIKERKKEYVKTEILPTVDITKEPSTFKKVIIFFGWIMFVIIILSFLYGIVKLYLKFKPF